MHCELRACSDIAWQKVVFSNEGGVQGLLSFLYGGS